MLHGLLPPSLAEQMIHQTRKPPPEICRAAVRCALKPSCACEREIAHQIKCELQKSKCEICEIYTPEREIAHQNKCEISTASVESWRAGGSVPPTAEREFANQNKISTASRKDFHSFAGSVPPTRPRSAASQCALPLPPTSRALGGFVDVLGRQVLQLDICKFTL